MSYSALPISLFVKTNLDIPEIEDPIKTFRDNWLTKHASDNMLILYHYTTLAGLKGIITNRSIWCTQINAMNDPLEFQYGQELITNKINHFIERETNTKLINILNVLRNFATIPTDLGTHNIFIASFCEKDNLLSQWRGYSVKGGGYNLGICFDSETKICNDTKKSARSNLVILRKVIYDPDEQDKIIEEFLEILIKGIKSVLDSKLSSDDESLEIEVCMLASNILIDMMISMKNPHFEEEEEWRLIRVVTRNQIPEMYKFRGNDDELIPYLNTYLFKEEDNCIKFPLKKIRFGPMLEKTKTEVALALFVSNNSALPHDIKLNNVILIQDSGYVLR